MDVSTVFFYVIVGFGYIVTAYWALKLMWRLGSAFRRRREQRRRRRNPKTYTYAPILAPSFGYQHSQATHREPLEETWTPDKIEAWRIINVHVEQGDPDGIWLGFPHPDGPTPDRVTPVRHPVGVEIHAECGAPQFTLALPGWSEGSNTLCRDVPGEQCQSGIGYGCGFYAFKTRDQAVELQRRVNVWESWGAIARVLLSGKVIEHELGYRAEILEVVEIETPGFNSPDYMSYMLVSSLMSNYITFGNIHNVAGKDIADGGV